MTTRIHPLTGELNGETTPRFRPELFALGSTPVRRRREIKASYDAARDSNEFKNYWANADTLDADSANSRSVRGKLVTRSRYEVANNGFADGMVQTHANYLVGVGPSLRMQTGSPAFNTEVETQWNLWCKAVKFRRKLWCLAHAKVQDGESLGLVRNNPRVRHPVKLDLVLIETEQCQTPMLPYSIVGYIDGIKFDEFGNPEHYDVLPYHPGGSWATSLLLAKPEQVPARFVLHWYMLRRPGQHRGVPEFRSTLNVGASSRRWREATVGAAETAAEFTMFLKTAFPPDEMDVVSPMSTLDIQKRMMTALPNGWDPFQMKAEHPNSTYAEFHKAQINEQGRPKSIPYNLAACDSSSYNYASGRLDHQTYFGALDVEREDGNDLVLDPLFGLWFEEAALLFGWNVDPASAPKHTWDWPKHPVADVQSEATANDKKLRNGQTSPSRLYAESGLDFEDEVQQLANDYGVSVDEIRKLLRIAIFNSSNQQASIMLAEQQAKKAQAEAEQIGLQTPDSSQEPADANPE